MNRRSLVRRITLFALVASLAVAPLAFASDSQPRRASEGWFQSVWTWVTEGFGWTVPTAQWLTESVANPGGGEPLPQGQLLADPDGARQPNQDGG